jgi:hypothetical protein
MSRLMKTVRKQKRRPGLPRTMSIPEAGWEFYGLGEAASYAAAKRGEIPYVQVGSFEASPHRFDGAKADRLR